MCVYLVKRQSKIAAIITIAMMLTCLPAHAVVMNKDTEYPSPTGNYRYMEVNDASSANIADFSNTLAGNGLGITTTYLANAYTPGIFWASENDNAGIPKAGIWTWNGRSWSGAITSILIPYDWPGDNLGSYLLMSTSRRPASSGINDLGTIIISPLGYVGLGIDPTASYEPQSRLWVDNGFVSVQNGPPWSTAQWPISYTSGQAAAMTIAGPHELDATATAMGVGDGYLGFGITSDSAAAPEGSKNAGWYFIRAQDKFGVTTNAPEYPVVFKGGAPASSLYVSEEGNVFMGPANLTIPAPSGAVMTSPANAQATNNLQVNDVYMRSVGRWASAGGGAAGPVPAAKLSLNLPQSIPSDTPTSVLFNVIDFDRGNLAYITSVATVVTQAGFRIQRKGIYKLVGLCGADSFPSAKYIKCSVSVNGDERAYGVTNCFYTTTGPPPITVLVNDILQLNVNDVVQMAITHDAGSIVNTSTQSDMAPRLSIWEVYDG